MSRLPETISNNPLVVQKECERVSVAALGLVETFLEDTKCLRLPQLSHSSREDVDIVAKLRVERESLEQQHAQAELELETLRRAILARESELEKTKANHAQLLEKSTLLFNSKAEKTKLPVCIVIRIFRFVRLSAAKDPRVGLAPLYNLAQGFSDLPRWQRAISNLIPTVLIHASSLYNDAYYEMSYIRSTFFSRNPRLYELSDEEKLADIDFEVPVTLILKDNHVDYKAHLERSKRFKWNALVLLTSTALSASSALQDCGERLWHLRDLEIASLEPEHEQGFQGDMNELAEAQASTHDKVTWMIPMNALPLMPDNLAEPSLRRILLPIGAIFHYAPLMSKLELAEITVPGSVRDTRIVARGLQDLPPSLSCLSLTHEGLTTFQTRTENIDIVVSLPRLVDLEIRVFEAQAMNELLNCFDCPSLRALRAQPSSLVGRNLEELTTEAEQAEMQVRFVDIAHQRFPRLTDLDYYWSDMSCVRTTCRPFLERLMKRNDEVGGTNVAPESAYLLPRLQNLFQKDPDVDEVSLLISLAALRRREDKVSNLRTIHIDRWKKHARKKSGRGIGTDEFWHDCHVDALHLFVPDS